MSEQTGEDHQAATVPGQGDVYTHGHHESVLRSHASRTAANSAAYLVPYLTHGLSLLDVGSGPGTITADFAWLVAPGPVLGLDQWMELYQKLARHNQAEPDAGRRLLHWAKEAGFVDVAPSSANWLYGTKEDQAWLAGVWADRVSGSAFAEQAVAYGFADAATLEQISTAWRAWAKPLTAGSLCPTGKSSPGRRGGTAMANASMARCLARRRARLPIQNAASAVEQPSEPSRGLSRRLAGGLRG